MNINSAEKVKCYFFSEKKYLKLRILAINTTVFSLFFDLPTRKNFFNIFFVNYTNKNT
jgi:hypothetical protein